MTRPDAAASAAMPAGTHKVLDRRTVEIDNKNLLKWLRSGISVLDAGCGSGAITKGIAEKVGPGGRVTGIDSSEHLIALANEHYRDISNLQFRVADIYTFESEERFDVISSARVLQWLASPGKVIFHLKKFLKENGVLSILDYNHEKIKWDPAPPPEMQLFYDAFLQWRKDAGFDNAIADHLGALLRDAGLKEITVEPQLETTSRNDADFKQRAAIWSEVAATRGQQLVKDNYITEEERLAALRAYDKWVTTEGRSMQLYLLAVEGKNSER